MAPASGKELFPCIGACLPFGGAKRFDARPPRIENGARRQLQPNEVVAGLPGQDAVVLPAIEAPAQQRPALIDCASRRPQMYTPTTRICCQQKNGIACLVSIPYSCRTVSVCSQGGKNPILRETASGNDSSEMHGPSENLIPQPIVNAGDLALLA
jgi:hypothetical protein